MKVLISDHLSDSAISIFKNKGIDVDYLPDISRERLKKSFTIMTHLQFDQIQTLIKKFYYYHQI